jgi:hypothetical protein
MLVLFQDLYMFRAPSLPFIRSTILQLAVIGITYIALDREMYGSVHFKVCPEWVVGHITVVNLELNHSAYAPCH